MRVKSRESPEPLNEKRYKPLMRVKCDDGRLFIAFKDRLYCLGSVGFKV